MAKTGSEQTNGFARIFFEALGLGKPEGDERALKLLREAALPSGLPSPKAKPFVESGEWDRDEAVTLRFVAKGACRGRVGQTKPGEPMRFCGQTGCQTSTHQKTRAPIASLGRWFIAGGKFSLKGLLVEPSLPPFTEGGPVVPSASKRLSQAPAFLLTTGQWKFVFASWKEEAQQDSVVLVPRLKDPPIPGLTKEDLQSEKEVPIAVPVGTSMEEQGRAIEALVEEMANMTQRLNVLENYGQEQSQNNENAHREFLRNGLLCWNEPPWMPNHNAPWHQESWR